uniref:Uncharacterized protein n=1 Tax=Setaria italica TaxID=4555 RepID=K4A473_SETIT
MPCTEVIYTLDTQPQYAEGGKDETVSLFMLLSKVNSPYFSTASAEILGPLREALN